ncbi:pirin family protein [Novosphingobium profundi]|uniref:pirin family protein n=1 Tax=Novosphingobium profundi TaxID=1774954 RepID=UPI001BD9D0EF|nr:pirin family protein [Novosphingobium profundi]MBT0668665.1 pirin family protein [Novosphingobium profundi]
MITFRDRGARGRHSGAEVDARHSFSFGDYIDPKNMGFRALRVLNEERIIPGGGFAEHAHQDMEIITLVLEGTVRHRDDLGNETRIRAGEVQRMSAGTGVRHSERNPSADSRTHILQIWIHPSKAGLAPSYEQRSFDPRARHNRFGVLVSEDGREGSLSIHQDAVLELACLDEGTSLTRSLDPQRGYWVQVISGIIGLNGTELRMGDGAALTQEQLLALEADTDCEVLLIDLP